MLPEFFDEESKIEKLINVMQIAFNIWNQNSDKEIKNDIFIFFFTASCFIVLKVKNKIFNNSWINLKK